MRNDEAVVPASEVRKLEEEKKAVYRFGPSVEKLPHPIEWLTDNGGQYTAHETKAYGKE